MQYKWQKQKTTPVLKGVNVVEIVLQIVMPLNEERYPEKWE